MLPGSKLSMGLVFINPASTAFSTSTFSSSAEPIVFFSFLSSVTQIGKGTPQYLDRDKFQSTRFSNQLPNLPSPVDFGFQLIVLFSLIILSLSAVVLINQLSNG